MTKFFLILLILLGSLSFEKTLLAQDTTLCHQIDYEYSKWMDDDVLNKLNYEMFSSDLRLIEIVSVERIDTHIVRLAVPVLPYKVNYVIRVSNVHDLNGIPINPEHNSEWVYFEGYDSTETRPRVIFKQ